MQQCDNNDNDDKLTLSESLRRIAEEGVLSDFIQLCSHTCVDANMGLTVNCSTILMISSYHGNIDMVEYLVEKMKADVNYLNDNGTSALIFACNGGHMNIVSYLCVHGANPNFKMKSGDSALHVAAERGYSDIISYLCTEANATINCRNETNQTPLHAACESNCLNCVSLLLQYGADIDSRDDAMATPLINACSYCYNDVVTFLLEQKADFSNVSERICGQNCDVDEIANNKKDTIRILMDYGWLPKLDFFHYIKTGNLDQLKLFMDIWFPYVQEGGGACCFPLKESFRPDASIGDNGANAVMIASLLGHAHVVNYLLNEPYCCNREVGQQVSYINIHI